MKYLIFSPRGISETSIVHKATMLSKIHIATQNFRIILASFLFIIFGKCQPPHDRKEADDW